MRWKVCTSVVWSTPVWPSVELYVYMQAEPNMDGRLTGSSVEDWPAGPDGAAVVEEGGTDYGTDGWASSLEPSIEKDGWSLSLDPPAGTDG